MYGYLTCGAPTKHGGSNWRSIPWVPWAEARLYSIILVCTPAGPPSHRRPAPRSERIFALVKTMFGEEALNALSDYIQAALMLRYAERTVG